MFKVNARICLIGLTLFTIFQIYTVSGVGTGKKGVVHWWKNYKCNDFKILDKMEWWYEYHQNLQYLNDKSQCSDVISAYKDSFVPMVWGKTNKINISSEAKYILGFNEPNHNKQSNMTPAEAVDYWQYIQGNSAGQQLISPAAATCGGSDCISEFGDRDEWFDEFFKRCENCNIAYLATHTYFCNARQVMRHLRGLYERYNKTIWLTELGCGNYITNATEVLEFMKEILPQLEKEPFIFRYAWYKARVETNTWVTTAESLLDPENPGKLTPLGFFYNNFEGTEKVDGVWGEWRTWSDCTVTCGGGTRTRSRPCVYPNPLAKELPCIGDDTGMENCNTDTCPSTDGVWGEWTQWGMCSVTCGGGDQLRSRTCEYPDPGNPGAECVGQGTQTQSCTTDACTVDGVWGAWTQWGMCSVTCGGGDQLRSRTCEYPDPGNQGAECAGQGTQTQNCNTDACTVDGVWGAWTQWGMCSVTCGGGDQLRSRTCEYPDPGNQGAECAGQGTQTQNCNTDACTVDGVWGAWTQWGMCSVTCGGGDQLRSRTCEYPDPGNQGAECAGQRTQTQNCNADACTADGVWGAWTQWSTCSATCGGGDKSRTRTCEYPEPGNTGAECVGDKTETSRCNTDTCTGDEECTSWSIWSQCSVRCGRGIKTRSCSKGSVEQTKRCRGVNCRVTVDGVWKSWSALTECSVTCGKGEKHRTRTCWWPTNVINGDYCAGSDLETIECHNAFC